jgi:hypothetical protein
MTTYLYAWLLYASIIVISKQTDRHVAVLGRHVIDTHIASSAAMLQWKQEKKSSERLGHGRPHVVLQTDQLDDGAQLGW